MLALTPPRAAEMAACAHDLNNFLTTVVAGTEIALVEMKGMGCSRRLESIREAAVKASAMARQMMRCASAEEGAGREALDVGAFVKGWADGLSHLPREIEVAAVVCEETPRVAMEALDLERVLLNLAMNARDAMAPLPGPKRLAISTNKEEDFAVIRVRDNGPGMSPAMRRRVFKRGFTTKGHTGLGLTTSRYLVEKAGGRMELESEEGRWTEFSIFLPRVK